MLRAIRLASSAITLVIAAPALAAGKDLPPPPPPSKPPPVARTVTTTSAAAPRESATSTWTPSQGENGISVAPLLGFATDDLNLGIGVRGAKMITDRFSIGGTFVYQFGRSEGGTTGVAVPGYTNVASYSASMSLFYLGPEAGYDFYVAPVTLRPYAGLGLAQISTSVSSGGVSASNSDTKLVIWPGCQVIYDVPDTTYFVGGDVRFVTVPGGPSFGMFAMGGMKL